VNILSADIYTGKYDHLFLIYSEKQMIPETIIKVEDCIFSIPKRNDRDKEKNTKIIVNPTQ